MCIILDMKKPRFLTGAFWLSYVETGALCSVLTGAQAHRQFPIDIDERVELGLLRIEFQFNSLSQNEHTEIGDVLPNICGQWTVVA